MSSSHGHRTQLSPGSVNSETKDGLHANKPAIVSVQSAVTEPPASIPVQSSGSLTGEVEKSTSNSKASPISAPSATVSGVYSSASDPVLTPTMSWHAGAVGAIKREIGRQSEAAEINHIHGNKNAASDIDVSKIEKTASEVPNSMHEKKSPRKSKVVEPVKQSKLIEADLLQGIISFNDL